MNEVYGGRVVGSMADAGHGIIPPQLQRDPLGIRPDEEAVSVYLVTPERDCVAIVTLRAFITAPKVVRFKGRTFLRDVKGWPGSAEAVMLKDGDIYVEVLAARVDDNVQAVDDDGYAEGLTIDAGSPRRTCIAYGLIAGALLFALGEVAIVILTRVLA